MSDTTIHSAVQDPSSWIARFAVRAAVGCTALDLACGGGRHGRLLLGRGHDVVFVDRDVSGVADLADDRRVETVEADLENDAPWPLADRRFGLVVVANYLWRPILPKIVGAVAPGGLLLYETFAVGNEAHGRPRNPDFLLKDGELLEAVRGHLSVLAYGQLYTDRPSPRVVQRIAARNTG